MRKGDQIDKLEAFSHTPRRLGRMHYLDHPTVFTAIAVMYAIMVWITDAHFCQSSLRGRYGA
jgi:hypothetical protein